MSPSPFSTSSIIMITTNLLHRLYCPPENSSQHETLQFIAFKQSYVCHYVACGTVRQKIFVQRRHETRLTERLQTKICQCLESNIVRRKTSSPQHATVDCLPSNRDLPPPISSVKKNSRRARHPIALIAENNLSAITSNASKPTCRKKKFSMASQDQCFAFDVLPTIQRATPLKKP